MAVTSPVVHEVAVVPNVAPIVPPAKVSGPVNPTPVTKVPPAFTTIGPLPIEAAAPPVGVITRTAP